MMYQSEMIQDRNNYRAEVDHLNQVTSLSGNIVFGIGLVTKLGSCRAGCRPLWWPPLLG
jgi:hypothetical protein